MSQLEQDIELLVNNAQTFANDDESQMHQDAAMLQVRSCGFQHVVTAVAHL